MTPRKKPDIWPGMSYEQHTALMTYIILTAKAIGLGHWTFVLCDEPAEEGNMAQMDCVYGQHYANIKVQADWFDLKIEMRRHAVMHELVHAITDRVLLPYRDSGREVMAPDVYTLLYNGMNTQMEFAVDEIARHFVKFSDDREITYLLEGRLQP